MTDIREDIGDENMEMNGEHGKRWAGKMNIGLSHYVAGGSNVIRLGDFEIFTDDKLMEGQANSR
jgi:hypothetical protein